MLRVAYYPSASELLTSIDLRPVTRAGEITRLQLTLQAEGGGVGERWAIARDDLTTRTAFQHTLALPPLADGSYSVELRADAGPECRAIVGPRARFEHRAFPWANSSLGTTPRVIPPFTPLEARGGTVSAVSRTHRLAESGLFAGVVSDGAELLAAPMRWDVMIGGASTAPSVARALELTRVSDDRVDAAADLRFGPLSAELRGRFDVDGLYRVRLSLRGPPSTRIDRFDLVIPLRGDANLMNAITDGLRHHTLGAISSGSGRVWDSRNTGREELPPGFVPYLWLGNETRGLAWMTASGRDFWFRSGEAMAEIRRAPERVELVIHFATRPASLEHARTLEFALQATPAKPRPPDWRRWQPLCRAPADIVSVCSLVTGWYWGAESLYGDARPRRGDYGFLERLAGSRRAAPLPPRAADAWLERSGVQAARDPAMARASLRWAANALSKRPRAVLAYINARGVASGPELRVYHDEWRLLPFGDDEARSDGALARMILPRTSFANYVLFHLDRLLATGAIDGVYFDNAFLVANWDEHRGNAWRDLDGRLQPGVDLWELRELLRRAQTLIYERRAAWWTLVHGTTTPISAAHGWAGIFLDGEWRYGSEDFQRRFPRGLLRAGSLGSQLGAITVFLPGIEGVQGARAAELGRELAGVAAVHELRVLQEGDGAPRAFAERLHAFGYGAARCSVHRYWDEPARFHVRGGDVAALLVTCGRNALALLVNYGQAGNAQLELDTAALGLPATGECADPELGERLAAAGSGCRAYLLRDEVRWIERRGGATR